jgi:hypothetical protein
MSKSLRISGLSETGFKSSMTLKEFIEMKKSKEKDQLVNGVMVKVVEKFQDDISRGIINCYVPSSITLKKFDPNNLNELTVTFGLPITNKKSTTDALYLAPEVINGEKTTPKSVAFSIAVIWDELIHDMKFFPTVAEVENLASTSAYI